MVIYYGIYVFFFMGFNGFMRFILIYYRKMVTKLTKIRFPLGFNGIYVYSCIHGSLMLSW